MAHVLGDKKYLGSFINDVTISNPENPEPGAKKSRAFFHSFKYWSDRRDNRAELQNCPKIDPKTKTKINNRLSQNLGNLTLEDRLAQLSTPKIKLPKGDRKVSCFLL